MLKRLPSTRQQLVKARKHSILPPNPELSEQLFSRESTLKIF
jgi:hypothetical protein